MRSTNTKLRSRQGLLFDSLPSKDRVGHPHGKRSKSYSDERKESIDPLDGPKLRGKTVVLDVETDGLNPYSGNRIFCWSYMTELGEYGFMLKTPKAIEWIKKLFDTPGIKIVFHHGKFDLKMFTFEGVDIYNAKAEFHDTEILAKLNNGLLFEYGLRYLGIKYLNRITDDKDEVIDWLKSNSRRFKADYSRAPNFTDAPIEVVKKRALWDVETTLQLFFFLYSRIQNNCGALYKTERELMLVCIDMENTGVKVDITRARKLKSDAEKNTERLKKDLQSLVGEIDVERKKKGQPVIEHITEFNAGSNQHLVAAFKKLGIELLYKTEPKKGKRGKKPSGGGNWAFDEYAMVRYVSKPLALVIREASEEGWPIDKYYSEVWRVMREYKLDRKELLPPLVLKIRETTKMVSTYYDHIIENAVDVEVEPSGREVGILHCSFNQSEAMTGRFSCSDPNLQNMPRILGPRECFIPRWGRRNWHWDYEQVEMKFFAHFAKDPDMAAAIDDDIHLFVASEIYELPKDRVSKEQRKRAKGINFGIIYGAGPPKIAITLTKKGLHTTSQEATVLCVAYHRRFPSIRKTTRELQTEIARVGYVENPLGRRYHIDSRESYKTLNYLCQGTSADTIKKAMVAIWKMLRAGGFKAKMLITVHDELVIEIPPSEEATLAPRIKAIMEDRKTYFVPITVDAEIASKRWSQKEKIEKYGFSLN